MNHENSSFSGGIKSSFGKCRKIVKKKLK